MKKILLLLSVLTLSLLLGCTRQVEDTPNNENPQDQTPNTDDIEAFVEAVLNRLTLEEKIGQMLQAEEKYITPDQVKSYNIGSILNGGGSHPHHYTDGPEVWFNMVKSYQEAALDSSSGIPLLYGTDAVHGHNNVYGATIFPHNINLGMMNDPDLVRQVAEATAHEMLATGIPWNFAPAVSVARDIRWGRTYEAFSEDPRIHEGLVTAMIQGMQDAGVVATAKHFVADGGTYLGLDQGDARLTESDVREVHLPPFIEAIDAGVLTIMVSYSSLNGEKMHGSHKWLTEVLKEELGFEGLVLSDWNATFQLEGNFQTQLVTSVNAGVDMLMLPQDWQAAHGELLQAVRQGRISEARIDDAVRRILRVKAMQGLFDDPFIQRDPENYFATDTHIALARDVASRSMVLLKNDDVLPLSGHETIYLTGPAHDHVGYLSGGWTTHWQGNTNPRLGSGTSILEAVQGHLEAQDGRVVSSVGDADVVVVVFTEIPYSEGHGDTPRPSLFHGLAHPDNQQAYQEALDAKAAGKTVIGVIVSGRPLLLENTLETFDALIAAFLPGTEGGPALADLLYGQTVFSAQLSFAWPATLDYFDDPSQLILYPFGHGLTYDD